jgi:predicted phosphodiesterase
MSAPVIRIFSDLHYRDGASSLQSLESLASLLPGADQVVLNGDTLDTQAPSARPLIDEARAFFAQRTPHVTFLSGNHDPDISPHGELSLHDGRVWITHGDVFFDEIAPWSSLRTELIRRLERHAQEAPPEDPDRVEARLLRNRIVCQGLPEPHDRFDRSLRTRLLRIIDNVFPPDRLLSMLRVWLTTPTLARRLAQAQRSRARLVVLGHTHFPGVWRHHNGPVVVNTGSFCRPFGGLFVELRGEHVQVVRIVQKRGEFHPGRIVAGFSLAP